MANEVLEATERNVRQRVPLTTSGASFTGSHDMRRDGGSSLFRVPGCVLDLRWLLPLGRRPVEHARGRRVITGPGARMGSRHPAARRRHGHDEKNDRALCVPV